MALETATYIADLNPANPTASDPKSDGDDHIRTLKKTVLNSLPGFAGAVLVSGTDGGAVNAYTLTPATALGAYTARTIAEFTPTVTNTGAVTLNVSGLGAKAVTSVAGAALVANDLIAGMVYLAAYNGTEFRLLAITKNYADQLAFASSLPAQAGNAGKYVTTDGTVASWVAIVPPQVVRSARTANTILGVADSQKLIDITSGTFSQTFDAAATLGNGWYCWLRNSGTGDITLDPNAAELIDGLSTFVMYPGEARLIQSDGTALRSVVIAPFFKTFTASGNFIKPPGYSGDFGFQLWAGGGSGRKDSAVSNAYGGGGGACAVGEIAVARLAATETVTIGAGGAAQTVDATDGNAGGTSSLGSLIFAYGGKAGAAAATNGGAAFIQNVPLSDSSMIGEGTAGTPIAYLGGGPSTLTAGQSRTIFGGAGGGARTSADAIVSAGSTVFGGSGGAASIASSGAAGVAPGGGGGATKTGATSGAGARGELRIWGIA